MRKLLKPLIVSWLSFFARLQLTKLKPRVIAVAGSSGKTSTASAIVEALRPFMRVRSGVGLNTETGVPLGILGIGMEGYGVGDWLYAVLLAPWMVLTDWRKCDAYVAEYGIDHPGDMKALLRIRVPDIAVLTSVGLEHAGYFMGSLEEVTTQIVDEELSFLEALSEQQTAIAPVGDPAIADRLHDLRARVVRVGDDQGRDYALVGYRVTPTSTSFEVCHKAVSYPTSLPFPVTRASAESMVLAAAAASEAGVPLRDAVQTIANAWEVPAGRGRVFVGKRGMTIIDSSYNATPFAVADALGFLKDIAGARRKVAVLGDMRELGNHAPAAHEELVPRIVETCDTVVLIGREMTKLAGKIPNKVGFVAFDSVTDFLKGEGLVAGADGILQDGDVVLVKGSQNTLFLERVVEHLLARPEDAARLPRRGRRWDGIRAAAR